ncbi:MAG: leucine-rich repeat domain-containing protein [Candidatus Poribacteria bacterium]|nr:leucine-rich repeat domain-containing protein [Candidatus Poribacteria bacterium]
MYKRLYSLIVALFIGINITYAQEPHWMPDPALREAVRETLDIPADIPLTQAYLQEHLTGLNVSDKGIVNLTGLEHATDLQSLGLVRNKIQDLSPLSGLTGLGYLNLGNNQISDLRPLAALTRLEFLHLWRNQIKDISPLAGLVNLKNLNLSRNQIADISPLVGLPNLENFDIRLNEKGVLSTLPISKLMQFGYDEACDLEGVPISARIENREYPSIFSAWGNIINLPSLSQREGLSYHDIHWSSLLFDMQWLATPEGLRTFLHVELAKEYRDDMLSLNPNMIFIVSMNYQAANLGEYPEDWPYWLRDKSGNIIKADPDTFLIDFTHPEIQDYLVRQVIVFAKCGLFDGILLDWWRDEWHHDDPDNRYYVHDVGEAAITMLRRMREGVDEVRDDFLIIANTVRSKIPRSAPYINGIFMETTPPYSYTDLGEIENTLLWAEENLQEPRINCLEGYADKREPLDSATNQQWMRLFTTMNLTHSGGYVNFVSGGLHEHHWYPFYDAPLGRPVGGDETKGQLYENREGLFIREFTNGWAVYNRSGKEQTIEFSEAVSGVASGVEGERSHTLRDLDGEIYLKSESGLETPPTVDVNGDGVVNIQDLVIVANALGEAEPDLNGDGVVNIQDLVIVANAF